MQCSDTWSNPKNRFLFKCRPCFLRLLFMSVCIIVLCIFGGFGLVLNYNCCGTGIMGSYVTCQWGLDQTL